MRFADFFWLLFVFFALAPMYRQYRLNAARIRTMERLQRRRGSRVITMIHRQESMSILGIPVARFINIEDSEKVLRAIRLTPDNMPIDIILHTPGGLVLAAEQISRAIRNHPGKVTVFVPHYAMSGGTLIALSADEIVMDENAVMGPVDPQIGRYPAASILRVLEKKEPRDLDDDTLVFADIAEKAIRQVEELVRSIMAEKMSKEQAEEVARVLTHGYWTHDYPLTCSHLKKLGINVREGLPVEVYQLMELYPQAPTQRPSVGYVPITPNERGRE